MQKPIAKFARLDGRGQGYTGRKLSFACWTESQFGKPWKSAVATNEWTAHPNPPRAVSLEQTAAQSGKPKPEPALAVPQGDRHDRATPPVLPCVRWGKGKRPRPVRGA